MKRALPLILACALVTGCGSDDGSGDEGNGSVATPPEGTATDRFESRRIGFTFEYPAGLVAMKRPRRDVLAQVSLERGAILNAIKIRRTSDRERGSGSYLDEFERDFERTAGTVEQREEEIGGLDMGVLEFEDTVELDGETVEFSSTSYFFAGGGRTWQVECIADEEHRDQIERACATVLDSIDFRPGR